ncbi:hypothetical protein [Halalkalibacter krulwichiae]|uniref:Cytochrome C and Quinol oxidase polypeptide I n=1 Tax=Halalkalibacter krulwichiae TaxID=199441 RepID=A0A1X9MF13_9BACI|nr:hypothetical protein [Halalkalibacter krulwichiae]ARK32006.1 hypothetical protein BkAM31D_20345 [Halalkalibacter krulwichiae]
MNRTKILLRFSAIYAVIGIFIGSHMAGAGSYLFRAIHAHILLVGWLSLFAFAAFYALFSIPKTSRLANYHVWTALIGSFGLTFGMWMHYFQPAWAPETFSLIFYIVGGSILMASFMLFAVMTFVFGPKITDKE